MPITLSGTRITITYTAGDTKGDSWSNPYTIADIYAAAVAGGWTGFTKFGDNEYHLSYSITISSGYVHFYNAVLTWNTAPVDGWMINTAANFKSGGADLNNLDINKGCTFIKNFATAKHHYFSGYSYIYNSVFTTTVRNTYSLYGTSSYAGCEMKRTTIIGTSYVLQGVVLNWTMDDITVVDSEYGLTNSTGVPIGTNFNITKYKGRIGNMIYMFSYSVPPYDNYFKLKDADLSNATLGLRGYYTSTSRVDVVDSIAVPTTVRANYSLSEIGAKAIFNNFTTVKFYLNNAANATVTIKDKNLTTVYTQVTDGNGLLSDYELLFYTKSQEKTGTDSWLNIDETYSPFTMTIEKEGCQTATITITPVAGQPTIIRQTLLNDVEQPTIYYQNWIEGTVTPVNVVGAVTQSSVQGAVTTANITGEIINDLNEE